MMTVVFTTVPSAFADSTYTPTLTAIPGDGQVTVEWTVIEDGTLYRQFLLVHNSFGDEVRHYTSDGIERSHTFIGLENGVEYSFTISSLTFPSGWSDDSAVVKATPMAPIDEDESEEEVNDTIAPTFDVNGNTVDFTTNIELGNTYDIGTINNIVDASITTESITDSSNIAGTTPAEGTYTVTYTVTDIEDNSSSITETVNVYAIIPLDDIENDPFNIVISNSKHPDHFSSEDPDINSIFQATVITDTEWTVALLELETSDLCEYQNGYNNYDYDILVIYKSFSDTIYLAHYTESPWIKMYIYDENSRNEGDYPHIFDRDNYSYIYEGCSNEILEQTYHKVRISS